MLTIPETAVVQDFNAIKKANKAEQPWRFAVQAMLAGAYVGVGVVLMVSASGPLMAEGSPWVKLVNGTVFGVALMLVVAAGGELVTSSMMTLTQGWARQAINGAKWGTTLGLTFVANLVGALVFAATVHFSGLLDIDKPAGMMLNSMLEAKAHESSVELFTRGILCNVLVCVAIWSVARLKSETAQFMMIFWCILAFITSGFEHVVANMTTYGLGMFGGMSGATVAEFGRNMLMVGLGNLVGGALIGLAYVSYDRRPSSSEGR